MVTNSSYGFVLMALCLLVVGLCPGCTASSLVLLEGHSMHAGGAISLAATGVPPVQIQAIGRWKLDTFKHYIHHHPMLLQAVLFHGQSIHDPPFANVL